MRIKWQRAKHYQKNKQYVAVIGIILSILALLLLKGSVIKAGDDEFTAGGKSYLLGSGLTDCQEAAVRYILWTEDDDQAHLIEDKLTAGGIQWLREDLQNAYGDKAVKFTISTVVDRQQEPEIDKMMAYLHRNFDKKGKSFFEERINSSIDLEQYFELNEVRVDQSGQEGKIMVLTGWSAHAPVFPQEGAKFNIEVLSTVQSLAADQNTQSKTILAMPALIEEF